MAVQQGKHSLSGAQGRRQAAQALTSSRAATQIRPRINRPKPKTRHNPQKARKQKPKKREPLPPSLRFTESRRGKTTVRRFSGRAVYRLEEMKGKPVECVEIFTASEHHAINVLFQDKTTLHFTIDPCFLLDIEYADQKTGDDWRRIKRWPLIRSETHRIER
jgi:hypothetical protein